MECRRLCDESTSNASTALVPDKNLGCLERRRLCDESTSNASTALVLDKNLGCLERHKLCGESASNGSTALVPGQNCMALHWFPDKTSDVAITSCSVNARGGVLFLAQFDPTKCGVKYWVV